ncbi:MAG TPA: DUF6338 family protein [Methylovirgula sp.]|nr:DUF6338 family protein [Methylovirgula sp.]
MVLSLVYYTLTIPFIDKALSIQHPWSLRAGIWIALTLAGPAVLGLLLGAEAQNEWLTWIAARFHLSVVHMIPAAWDWRFSKISASGTFVMVTLTSDEKVSGYFGSASFASSDSTERDLYIEEEYLLTDEGLWKPRPRRGECLYHLRKSNILNSGNRRIKVLKMSTSKHVPQASR